MRRALTWLLLALGLGLASQPSLAWCWKEAGSRYQIDPRLLWAIAKVESGFNPRAVNRNRDGSVDIGLMQVNSRHLAELKKYGYTERELMENPCAAVMAGSWILAGMIQHYGYNWRAVGAYNAGTAPDRDSLRNRYAQKVWQTYQQSLAG
ncbi:MULTISPECIES: lytic transglycosylase domain-containing protein [unclassified Paludibacterium]|uniref:lytic transglycosylase domain-containing protein n=1 Tax=unclassified Paludibacterium TaxID=2618429 RepID=UPI001C04FEA3|nr:lytic transglycosylase domain-containing protein [Paludibacterium sp. B53371]BEV73034.1 type III secretion system invasion protein IagB [Paludibacterium sp. THUN1379]